MTDAKNVENGGMGRRISEVGDLLNSMTIVDPGASEDFVDKLAAENGWTRTYAGEVYDEYLRFLLMAWMSPGMVVPSHDVDQAWHMHLTHTRHYWDVLCGSILQKPLHHEPSSGTPDEVGRHVDHYASTLSLYRYLFEQEAPSQIWPKPRATCGHARQETVLASGTGATAMAISVAVGMTSIMSGHGLIGAAAIFLAAVLLLKTIADSSSRRTAERRTMGEIRAATRQGRGSGLVEARSREGARTRSTNTDASGSDGALAFMAWTDPTPTSTGQGNASGGHSGGDHSATGSHGGEGHGGGGHTDGGHSCGGHSCGSSCGSGCGGGGD